MATEETFRHEFQTRVEEVLGAESARFLMAHLPPIPWPEVATKHDLELMEARTGGRFDAIRADLTLLISNQTRTMIFALITAVVAIAALALFR